MSNPNAPYKVQYQLNRSSPAMKRGKIGDVLVDLVNQVNSLSAQLASMTTKHNALVAKLDLDAGVTDTNYTSLTGVGAYSAVVTVDIESRNG